MLPNRHRWLIAHLLTASFALTTSAAAQVWPDSLLAGEPLPRLDGLVQDRGRLLQNFGLRDTGGSLIRSASAAARRTSRSEPPRVELVAPLFSGVWNTAMPASRNDGPLWAGRGASTIVTGGVRAVAGPFRLTLAPSLTFSQNRPFEGVLPDSVDFVAPWRVGRHSADLPIRFGDGPLTRLHWGESSLVAALGGTEVGVATESQWWGPGIGNAIVLSDNAGGFPHLFLGTGAPARTPVGDFEAKWVVGRLSESGFFDSVEENDRRSLSGVVATYRPIWEPNLTVGASRVVYARAGGGLDAFGHALDVFVPGRDNVPSAGDSLPDSGKEQILSLFGRWIFPEEGFEVYAEWARTELPASLRDLLTRPYHSQGYVLGLQWARPVRPGGVVRAQAEVAALEQSSTALRRYMPRYYTSPIVPQGYTHRGQVLGAGIGPGSSSQFGGVDYMAERWQAGIFAERVRWDNDAYYTRPNYAFGHDVSMLGGVRGGLRLRRFLLEGELATGTRFDYLFQNTAIDHRVAADSAVDVRNHSLRLTVTPMSPPRRRVAAPPPPAPLPPASPLGMRSTQPGAPTDRRPGCGRSSC